MRIRDSRGFANETDSRESDSDSQAFLMLCESPCHRRFVRVGTVHEYNSPVMRIRDSHGFASQADLRKSDTHSHMPISESINTGVQRLRKVHADATTTHLGLGFRVEGLGFRVFKV